MEAKVFNFKKILFDFNLIKKLLATLPPVSADKFKQALEILNVPSFLGGMARGLLGKNSEIQFRHCRKEALKEADLVVLIGTVADFRLGYGKVLSRKSKIISVNRNKSQLTKVN